MFDAIWQHRAFFDPETNASLGVTSAYDPSTGNVYSAEDVGLGLNQITDVEDGVEFQMGVTLT